MSEVKSLLHLPEEVLREIIRKVPRDHQRAVSESCKKLYEISYDVMFHTLTVGSRDFETKLNSLMTRRRRYERLRFYGAFDRRGDEYLSNIQTDQIMKVVKRFGNDVKYLSLYRIDMNESLVPLLNMMPNLKQIFLDQVDCKAENNDELNLNKLEEINFKMINSETMNQFKTLTPGVLRKLTIVGNTRSNNVLSNDVKLFPNQHNLDDLKINVTNYVANLDYENLRLKSLKWHSNRSTDFEKIIRTQYELKKLEITNDTIEEQKIICNQLSSLKELHLRAGKLDVSEFADFSKLKVLKKLSLSYDFKYSTEQESKQFNDCMTFLKSDSLIDLNLIHAPQFTEETIAQLAANLPQLKIFREESCSYRSFYTELSAIMKHFPILDKLQYFCSLYSYFSYSKDSKKVSIRSSFNCESEFNEWLTYIRCDDDLTELELGFSTISESQFKKLAAYFPQVKSLEISKDSGSHLGLMIRSFPKVNSLIAEFSTLQSFQYQDGFENDSLKKFSIEGQDFNEDFVKILGRCKKLEELKIGGVKDAHILQGILEVQQNLKTLIVDSNLLYFSEAIVISLKTHAKNLNLFDLDLIVDRSFSFKRTRDFINQKFKKDFELIELRTYDYSYHGWELLRLRWKMLRLVSPPVMSNNESYDQSPIPKKKKMSQ